MAKYDPSPVHSVPFDSTEPCGKGVAALAAELFSLFSVFRRQASRARLCRPWLCLVDVYHSPQSTIFAEGLERAWSRLGTSGSSTRTLFLRTDDALLPHVDVARLAQQYMTDDPVFGRVCADLDLQALFDDAKWTSLVARVEAAEAGYGGENSYDAIFVVGLGAMVPLGVREWADCAVIGMVPREYIYHPLNMTPFFHSPISDPHPLPALEAGSGHAVNGHASGRPANGTAHRGLDGLPAGYKTDAWYRYKRCYYFDWPIMDRHLHRVLPDADLVVDLSGVFPLDLTPELPSDKQVLVPESVMDSVAFVSVPALLSAIASLPSSPLRTRSLFMPGIWGGNRLRELVPGLGSGWMEKWDNVAWGFEVVAPEIGCTLDFGPVRLEVPFAMVLEYQAEGILGRDNTRRYGKYLPLRFNYLDTVGGSNLSVQVHPPTSYMRRFGEPIGQHESYYVVESPSPSALCYLGLQDGTDRRAAFLAAVAAAEKEGKHFDAVEHVQAHPCRPGDLFLIPAGTVHCSGAGNLVLEISTTPYLYTFKVYDYLRAGKDGKRRPISYDRGFEVLREERRGPWVKDRIVMRGKERVRTLGKGWTRYLLTNGEPLFPHDIERYELAAGARCRVNTRRTGFQMLSCVRGEAARLVPKNGKELLLKYGECCILPAAVGSCFFEAVGDGEVHVVATYMRKPGDHGADHCAGDSTKAARTWTVALDVGGTRLKSGVISEWSEGGEIWTELAGAGVCADDVDAMAGKNDVLSQLAAVISARIQDCAAEAGHEIRLAFSFPGPMDYAKGIPMLPPSLGGKYCSISGVHLPSALVPLLPADFKYSWTFENDAACAGLAEAGLGGSQKAMAITLGTGLGSCFVQAGKVLSSGAGVPENGWIYSGIVDTAAWIKKAGMIGAWGAELDRKSHGGTVIADDTWSVRGLATLLRSAGLASPEVVDADAVRDLDPVAGREALELFAATLGDYLRGFAESFRPSMLHVLGGIADGYWDAVRAGIDASLAPIGVSVKPGRLGAAAGVLGAAIAAGSK
ncbi:RmlC-like cupin domain-containing protein [Hyaloraphidium curvatum]|nr:RmlC-like cupin domain-containing protein [Hyaloraphidium curvatum]